MRKTINGRVYDTETAEKMFKIDNGEEYYSPFRICETLYRTRTGHYFLYGECGYLRAFSRQEATFKSISENIKAIAKSDAQEWLKNYGGNDRVIKRMKEEEVKK